MNAKTQARAHRAAHDTSLLQVTVRAGLFFDGTGNNRVNSRIGAECRAAMQAGQGEHTRECAGRHEKTQSSYSNHFTNIAYLFGLYREQKVARHDANGWTVYWPIYIGGAGTASGGRDSLFSGQGLGRGATGVLAKVDVAMKKLTAEFERFSVDNPGCVIQGLELDVFGFSRGAASARHLVNEVLKQEQGALGMLLDDPRLPLSADFTWGAGGVRVMVVGLFDTVAAVGSFRDLGNVRDFDNRRVNLYLPPGCARQVLHLVARDEWRRNFALNSVMPGWPKEIVLPGAHSDLGGGYHPYMLEEVLVTRPRTSVISRELRCEDSEAWQQATEDLHVLDTHAWVDPLEPQASMSVQCSHLAGTESGHGPRGRLVMAAVSLRRPVQGHLSRIHLRIMHALACDEGVPFEPIGDTAELALVEEVDEIARRLIAQARGDDVSLTAQQEQLLRWRYIHHSAHWTPIIGTVGSLGDALFVHAPQAAGRVLHPNAPQPGYPQ